MHIAVVIVGYRNSDDVVRCLNALALSSYPDFEVVICENGGEAALLTLADRTSPTLPHGQAVRLISLGSNLGFAGGVNACLRAAPDADAWWLLNPDTEPAADAMGFLVQRLSSGDCDAVGSALLWPDGRPQTYGGRWQSWFARAVGIGHDGPPKGADDHEEVERHLGYLSGASMMIGRTFLQSVGFMREDYFLYCEEAEWCLRAAARPMRLASAPEATVWHYHGTTTGNDADLTKRSRLAVFLLERNALLLTRDVFPARLPVAILASFAILFLRYGRGGAWRQFGHGVSGWLAGILNQRGPPKWMTA